MQQTRGCSTAKGMGFVLGAEMSEGEGEWIGRAIDTKIPTIWLRHSTLQPASTASVRCHLQTLQKNEGLATYVAAGSPAGARPGGKAGAALDLHACRYPLSNRDRRLPR